MIVCDTGPLVAAALANDSDHKACVELFDGLHAAGSQLLVLPGRRSRSPRGSARE